MERIHVAQNVDQSWVLVNTMKNLGVPYKAWNLTS